MCDCAEQEEEHEDGGDGDVGVNSWDAAQGGGCWRVWSMLLGLTLRDLNVWYVSISRIF